MTTTTAPEVPQLIDRWEREGLVSTEQAGLLRADVANMVADMAAHEVPEGRLPGESRQSLLTEALSYLGGVLVLVAGGLLTSRLWKDLAFGSRVLLTAAVTALLLGAGLVVPDRLGAAGRRVRRVLFVLSTAAFAGLLGLVAVDGLDLDGTSAGVLAAGGTTCFAAVLWWRERSVLQQLALLAATVAFAATASIELLGDHQGLVPGLALLGVAVLWGTAGQRRVLEPEHTAVLGAGAVAIIGATVTTGYESWTYLLAVAVVAALVAASVLRDDLPLLGLSALGALLVLPSAVSHWFPGVVAAALVLLVVGVGLIALGLTMAGRRAGSEARAKAPGPGAGVPPR